MSELLWFQNRQDQIREQREAHQETDGVVEGHLATSLHQSIARGDVADGDDEEANREDDENDVGPHEPCLSNHMHHPLATAAVRANPISAGARTTTPTIEMKSTTSAVSNWSMCSA
jgi:hypothetical protein